MSEHYTYDKTYAVRRVSKQLVFPTNFQDERRYKRKLENFFLIWKNIIFCYNITSTQGVN